MSFLPPVNQDKAVSQPNQMNQMNQMSGMIQPLSYRQMNSPLLNLFPQIMQTISQPENVAKMNNFQNAIHGNQFLNRIFGGSL